VSHYKAIFDVLTDKQRDVLGAIAINQDGGHHPKTLAALRKFGLISRREEFKGGWFPMTVVRYDVPVDIHIAWCEWCSEHLTGEDTL
jgi:hypothetical protein